MLKALRTNLERLALRTTPPTSNPFWPRFPIGGAREDRTPDLLRAKQVLSQLSYGPLDPLHEM